MPVAGGRHHIGMDGRHDLRDVSHVGGTTPVAAGRHNQRGLFPHQVHRSPAEDVLQFGVVAHGQIAWNSGDVHGCADRQSPGPETPVHRH